jgi:hypothetical protein
MNKIDDMYRNLVKSEKELKAAKAVIETALAEVETARVALVESLPKRVRKSTPEMNSDSQLAAACRCLAKVEAEFEAAGKNLKAARTHMPSV